MAFRPVSVAFALLLLSPVAAPAQFQSESYKFLDAVKNAKGDDVTAMLDKPGSRIVNTRDISSGDTALHIVVRRADPLYTTYLLQKGADPQVRNNKGDTPLTIAAQAGASNIVDLLVKGKADLNYPNSAGETALILAVHRRDADMVRQLLAAGADPDQADRLAGQSARAYAQNDPRNTLIARIIAETPKAPKRAVAGPKLR